MHYMLDAIFERAGSIRNDKMKQRNLLTERIGHTEQELIAITREMKLKIHNMVEEVEQKVSKALNEEIWRLNVLVDEFSLPFHTEPLVLNVYKKEINSHVENGLGSNLRARLSTALAMNIETAQREMTERMHALIPTDGIKAQSKQILTRSQPFEMFYTLNCQNLCADFHEELEFRFSWGITAMIQRFTGKAKSKSKGALIYNGQNNTNSVSMLCLPFWSWIRYWTAIKLFLDSSFAESRHKRTTEFIAAVDSYSPVGHFTGAIVDHITLCGGLHWIARNSWRSNNRRTCKHSIWIEGSYRFRSIVILCYSSLCSCWKRLDGVFWLALVLSMVVFICMNAYRGPTAQKNVPSKNNMFDMQRESWN